MTTKTFHQIMKAYGVSRRVAVSAVRLLNGVDTIQDVAVFSRLHNETYGWLDLETVCSCEGMDTQAFQGR